MKFFEAGDFEINSRNFCRSNFWSVESLPELLPCALGIAATTVFLEGSAKAGGPGAGRTVSGADVDADPSMPNPAVVVAGRGLPNPPLLETLLLNLIEEKIPPSPPPAGLLGVLPKPRVRTIRRLESWSAEALEKLPEGP